MKKINIRVVLLVALFSIFCIERGHSQAPIKDKYDTLYAAIVNTLTVANENYFLHTGSIPSGTNFIVFGDSVRINPSYTKSSMFRVYNTATNFLTPVNYQRNFLDYGISSAAAVSKQTPTTGLIYSFFGASLIDTNSTNMLILYRYNNISGSVNPETFFTNSSPDYRKGILGMCFFGPQGNSDTLLIFNHMGNTYYADSVSVIKKKYDQTGFVDQNIKLPVQLSEVNRLFVFNQVLYIAARDNYNNAVLLNSTNGTTFTLNTNYQSASFGDNPIVSMDTLNGYLYMALDAGDGSYRIAKTNNGINFSEVVGLSDGTIADLKRFRRNIYFTFYGSSSNPRPQVRYLRTNDTNVFSTDSLGGPYHEGFTYRFQNVNSKLYISGWYQNYVPTPYHYGDYVFQLQVPTAQFSLTTNTWCLNKTYTLVSQSLSADSIRWIKDNDFYYSNTGTVNVSFNAAGSHTVGLIAIKGTHKDTLKYNINVYGITAMVSPATNGCQHVPNVITPTVTGAVAPVAYSWTVTSGLSANSLTSQVISVSTSTPGPYAYQFSLIDANGCSVFSNNGVITINSSKNLSGVATVSALPVSGEVTVYRFEPINTKFDSVTTVTLNVSGEFTFSPLNADKYILKCIPTANSLQITYAPNAVSWKNALVVNHGCLTNTVQNISVEPLANIGSGPGVLSGKVVEGVGYGNKGSGVFAPGNPIGGLTVKGGRNPGGDISAQTRTNPAGEYTLSGFPVDVPGETYFVIVDVPGLDTTSTYHRAIITGSTMYTDLDFTVDSAKISPMINTGIKQFEIENANVLVYPNPTKGLLNIEVEIQKPQLIAIKITDIMGRSEDLINPTSMLAEKQKNYELDLSKYKPGIYFVGIKIGTTEKITKLILTD